MKILIFLLLITFSLEQNCTKTIRNNIGENCDNNLYLCKQFQTCSSQFKCQWGYVGSKGCTKDSDCWLSDRLSEGVRCVEGICEKPRYNGYACSHNRHVNF